MEVNRREFLFLAAMSSSAALPSKAQTPKPRTARKDSFFGLHFDLHPQANDTELGRDISEEMIDRLLTRVKPDYIQYDCKGHAGFLGYPSQVGTSSPGITQDSLKVWRRVTARHGVALYIHFSGLWDSLAIKQHPEWACVRADGSLDPNATSTFGPYVDELMIPQLKEAAAAYDLDGAWVDGDCWAAKPDYSERAAETFTAATGIRSLPRGPSDPGWLEFLEFNRRQFRAYVARYVDALHRDRPGFQIASNWLYTSYVPERPEIPIDFVSGDFLGNASISTARLEARYLSSIDKPWDLLAWGFQQGAGRKTAYTHKPAVLLEQEAAVVLAQGGGFQAYYQPTRAGRLDDRLIGVMGRLSRFCRDRQAVCHQSVSIPQIGVVFSTTSLYRSANRLFGGWGAGAAPARGFVDALIESGFSVDVLPEWKLEAMLRGYLLVVVPDWPDIGLKVKDLIVRYVRAGGKALVAGAENVSLFLGELGVRLIGEPADDETYIRGDEVFANVRGAWQAMEPGKARLLEERYPTFDSSRDAACAAVAAACGAGEIAAIGGPLGTVYAGTHAAAVRQFLRRIVDPLFTPVVRVEGPPAVEVALRRKDGQLLVHLLNSAGMQVSAEYVAGDFIPPIGPLRVNIRLPAEPKRVRLEPGGQPLPGRYSGGAWSGTLDRLEMHEIVAVDI